MWNPMTVPASTLLPSSLLNHYNPHSITKYYPWKLIQKKKNQNEKKKWEK